MWILNVFIVDGIPTKKHGNQESCCLIVWKYPAIHVLEIYPSILVQRIHFIDNQSHSDIIWLLWDASSWLQWLLRYTSQVYELDK